MDIFRKILGMDSNDPNENKTKREERQRSWFQEDDEEDFFNNRAFGRIFTSPEELHEHLQQQIDEIMRQFEENGSVMGTKDFKGFDQGEFQEFQKNMKKQDNDLDDKAYGEQLKVLLDRIDTEKTLPLSQKLQVKRTEEEQVMDRIHATHQEPVQVYANKSRPRKRVIASPHHIPNGVFDGNGSRIFGQSIISQTIRRPDGSVETRRTVRDADGHTKTTITRSENGQRVETITTYDDSSMHKQIESKSTAENFIVELDKNLTVSSDGYSMPRNLW